jgi:hypothetical protein
MAVTIRSGGIGFMGYGFMGIEFMGVGNVSGVCQDTILVTDSAAQSSAFTRPSSADTVLCYDQTVVSSPKGEKSGPGTGFMGYGVTGYAFMGVGSAPFAGSLIITDSISVTDAAARSPITANRSATDTILCTDVATPVSRFVRSAADTISVTDVAGQTTLQPRSASDTILVTDVATRAAESFTRAAADTIACTDVAAGAQTVTRTVIDFITIADAAARSPETFVRSCTDSIPVTDFVLARINRACLDTILVVDVATPVVVLRPEPGVITTSDSLVWTVTIADAPVSAVTLSDQLSELVSV